LLPKYFVRHYGNIIDDIEAKCDTYEEALHALKKIIKRAIERQKELEKLPKYNDW
jgi:RNA binding exosome subunit